MLTPKFHLMRKLLFIICALSCLFTQPVKAQVGDPARADTSSLREQFDGMLQVSRRINNFRTVRESFLESFMRNVSDSITVYTDDIAELNSRIVSQNQQLETQSVDIVKRDETISDLEQQKESISLLGIPLSKATYSATMWAIIVLLLAAAVFAISRMRSAIAATRRAKGRVATVTEELETSKRRRLEIEQNLRRKLQDEINKHR